MLDKIIEYQRAKGLTNQTFADRIGYNRTSWIRVKSGRAPLNDKLIKRIEAAFPDIFLPLNTTAVVDSGTAPLPLRARISRRLFRLVDKLYRKITARLIIEPDARED